MAMPPDEPASTPPSAEQPTNLSAPAPEPEPGPQPRHVRLDDVLARIGNFFANHAELDRALATELSSAMSALERV